MALKTYALFNASTLEAHYEAPDGRAQVIVPMVGTTECAPDYDKAFLYDRYCGEICRLWLPIGNHMHGIDIVPGKVWLCGDYSGPPTEGKIWLFSPDCTLQQTITTTTYGHAIKVATGDEICVVGQRVNNISLERYDSDLTLKCSLDLGGGGNDITCDQDGNMYVAMQRVSPYGAYYSVRKVGPACSGGWSYDTGSESFGIAIDDTGVYVADGGGLKKITNPSSGSPTLIWDFPVPINAWDVVVDSDGYVYLATKGRLFGGPEEWVDIYKLTNPSSGQPSVVWSKALGDADAYALALDCRERLWVAADDGVHQLARTDGEEICSYTPSGTPCDIAAL